MKNNKAAFFKRLESQCPEVLQSCLRYQHPLHMSMDGMDMVKLVNENHLTKFNDLTVVSDSETTSSTSWKRIVGIQQCYHCLRPI